MGILRTDIVSHSQLEGSGSVELDGVGDYLTFGSHSAFSPATADVTIELWVYLTDGTNLSSGNYYLFDMGSNGYRIQIYNGSLYWASAPGDNDYVGPIGNVLTNNTWHHIAGVRDNNSLELYFDGVHLGSKATTASITSTTFTIGSYSTGGGDYEPYGYISNFRYVRGVVYKNNFTPPKFELKNIPGTIVLGCQSATSATDFAVTPSTVTANGDATASAFHPGLKKDITDTGVVFDGVTTFDSQAYMVPPGGNTRERNRGRGVIGGGDSQNTRVGFIDIQSQGNANEFGQLTFGRLGMSACASSTRILFCGGYDAPTNTNIIDFFTIATTSNATDFGDLIFGDHEHCALSNQTRGLVIGGTGSQNGIEFVTIATTGNGQDFGDITSTRRGASGGASPTRGLFCGSATPQATAQIDFVTIATTGNSADFGDLTVNRGRLGSVSSSVRTVIAGGYTPSSPNLSNTIDFVTIATTGDAKDFGDLSLTASQMNNGMSNNSRGVFIVTGNPNNSTALNNLEFITIATTGNSNDFGDAHQAQTRATSGSDSHGGLAE